MTYIGWDGRGRPQKKGEESPHAKLSDADVREIYLRAHHLYAVLSGSKTKLLQRSGKREKQREIAEDYGIHQSTVSEIKQLRRRVEAIPEEWRR